MNNLMAERIKGILVGGAYGDAMGMPTEGWSYQRIKQKFPQGVEKFYPSQVDDISDRGFSAGEITDDTINTLMIVRSIADCQGQLNAENYVQQLINWHEESGISHLVSGPTTLNAINQIKNGISLMDTGKFGTTNGAAMKISPIGVISDYRNLDTLIQRVEQICLPTHHTSIAIAGASAVAACISYVVRGGKSISDLWELAYQVIQQCQTTGTDFPTPSLIKRMRLANKIVKESSRDKALFRLHDEVGSGVQTIETIPAVFGIIELAEGNPIVAGQLASSIGGDTDTIGAIACGICGGLYPKLLSEEIEGKLSQVNEINFYQYTHQLLAYTDEKIEVSR